MVSAAFGIGISLVFWPLFLRLLGFADGSCQAGALLCINCAMTDSTAELTLRFPYLAGLNERQREAVLAQDGPVLVREEVIW